MFDAQNIESFWGMLDIRLGWNDFSEEFSSSQNSEHNNFWFLPCSRGTWKLCRVFSRKLFS